MTARVTRIWGVKCLTDAGWDGGSKPTRYTEAEARQRASQRNTDPLDKETWEARLVVKPKKRRSGPRG